MTTALAIAPEPVEARLNLTLNGQNSDYPDQIAYDLPDAEIRRIAEEGVRGGYVPGITADGSANFTDFVVDRFAPAEGVAFHRIVLRPKVPFGG